MVRIGNKNVFVKIFDSLLDLIFPKKCLGCKKEGCFLCEKCFQIIEIQPNEKCVVCERQAQNQNQICSVCSKNFHFDQVFIMAPYKGIVKEMIKSLKFDYIEELSGKLAQLYYLSVDKANLLDKLNKQFIIPIPLHKKRFLERGFNQAELIAGHVSNLLEMEFDIKSLTRVKNTRQQANLNKKERLENMKQAFSADFDKTPEKVYLFDDVFTTGQTMNEAAKTLKQAGVKEVNVLALAHGH